MNEAASSHCPVSHAAVDCGPLASPVNGVVSIESTTLGSVAFYDCNQGFRLVGTETRNCQGSGVWSGSEPSCQGE